MYILTFVGKKYLRDLTTLNDCQVGNVTIGNKEWNLYLAQSPEC